ncbi:MAG: hypothetical protein KGI50_01025 [Patescibacteria group bacterium]|nr:hypothetical protein [Patescibacteria group bacterium]MDE2438066.1 hypothetical protein [Patescibacteria group bacterium]
MVQTPRPFLIVVKETDSEGCETCKIVCVEGFDTIQEVEEYFQEISEIATRRRVSLEVVEIFKSERHYAEREFKNEKQKPFQQVLLSKGLPYGTV